MSKTLYLTVCMGVVALAPTWAAAQAINVSQDRFIQAFTNSQTISDNTSLAGQWDRQVVATEPGFFNRGRTTMTSLVSTNRFAASALLEMSDDVQNLVGGGIARYDATFELGASTPYTLMGSWASLFEGTRNASLRFERLSPNPQVFHFSQYLPPGDGTPPTNTGSVNLAGILDPGVYRVFVLTDNILGLPGQFSATAQFNFDLVLVPAPGGAALIGWIGLLSIRRRRS